MPATTLEVPDLFIDQVNTGKAAAIIAEVFEEATHEVPGIFEVGFTRPLKARSILRDAVVRRYWSGPRNRTQLSLTVGPHSRTETVETATAVSDIFTADERALLLNLVAEEASSSEGGALPVGSFPSECPLPSSW